MCCLLDSWLPSQQPPFIAMPEVIELDQTEDLDVADDSSSQQVFSALETWCEKNKAKFQFSSLGYDRRAELGKIFAKRICSDDVCRLKSIEFVRILSRDKDGVEALVNEDLIVSLIASAQLQFEDLDDTPDRGVRLEALKCLCNLVFNSANARRLLGEEKLLAVLTHRIANSCVKTMSPGDIQLFHIRLEFLLTALCPELREQLRDKFGGLAALDSGLETLLISSSSSGLSDSSVDLIVEILKVLFNLTMTFRNAQLTEVQVEQTVRLVETLRQLLISTTVSPSRREPLLSNVVNQLTTFPRLFYKHLIPQEEGHQEGDLSAVRAIVDLMEMRLDRKSGDSSELTPVLLVLSDLARVDKRVRRYLRRLILPPLRDVTNRPEEGDTLRNKLVRLMTSVTDLSHVSADFLYALCKENVDRLIKYTGFGNAAGLLSTFGLLGGNSETENHSEEDSGEDSDTEEYRKAKPDINPVVGCVEPPMPDPTADWSEERKEYEANKLAELMHKLIERGEGLVPGQIGPDGRVHPIEHILQLQEGMQKHSDDVDGIDSD